MSASAWDRAVVLAKHQLATVLPGGVMCTCGAELAALNAPLNDGAIQGEPLALAVHQLAAALPVLLEELAQRIEEIRDSREHFEHCSLTQAAGIVRGFAAEVTQ